MKKKTLAEYSTLTEQEKWQCVARWLDSLFIAHIHNERLAFDPCMTCPLWWEKCSKNENHMPQTHFMVLEQHSGTGSIIGLNIFSGQEELFDLLDDKRTVYVRTPAPPRQKITSVTCEDVRGL